MNAFGSGSSTGTTSTDTKPASSGLTSYLPDSLQGIGGSLFGSGSGSSGSSGSGIAGTLSTLNTLNQASNLLNGNSQPSSGSGILSTLSNLTGGNTNKPASSGGLWNMILSWFWLTKINMIYE